MQIYYLILSSVSNQSFDLTGDNVNITDEIINIEVRTIKTIMDSVVFKAISSCIPPIHIMINIAGIIYFICVNHHFPSFRVLLLLFINPISFQLWIPTNRRHSTNTDSMAQILFTNMNCYILLNPLMLNNQKNKYWN